MDQKRLLAAPKNFLRSAHKSLGRGPKALKGVIDAQDIAEVAKLSSQAVLAWSLPERAWWPVTRLLGRIEVTTHPKRTCREIADVEALLAGPEIAANPRRIVIENWANQYGERFQFLRAWRPGGWTPEIDIVGAGHVSAALARGRGVIFWGGNFSFNNLVAKMAMHRLGLAVIGFSVPRHGFSKTVFGVRYLNRLYRDIENRYLKERLMSEPTQFAASLEKMREYLKVNGAVYFAVGGRARRTASVKFLGDRLILATAPLAMAHNTGAAMLPIYTHRVGPRRYEVALGPPLEVPLDANGNADYAGAVQAYADALTPFVLRDPGQWRAWRLKNPDPPWGSKTAAMPIAASSSARDEATGD
jgi:lauroyl/myristoyl acyltransferase